MTPSRIRTEMPNSAAQSKVRRKLEVRRILGGPTDTIPCPSNRMDQLRFEAFVDLGAQPADVGFDDIRARGEMNVPDVLEQHRSVTTWPACRIRYSSKRNSLGCSSINSPRRRTVRDSKSSSRSSTCNLVSAAVVRGLRPSAATRATSSEKAKGFTR